jgi:hypothetical protein
MGQKQAKPAATTNKPAATNNKPAATTSKPAVQVDKKTEFPAELLQELQPFIGSKKNIYYRRVGKSVREVPEYIPCYKFEFIIPSKHDTVVNKESDNLEKQQGDHFIKYIFYVIETENVFGTNDIYIELMSCYKSSIGIDYIPIDNVDSLLDSKNLIKKFGNCITVNGLYNINFITYQFIDLVKDYHPVLYKLLVWLKTGK